MLNARKYSLNWFAVSSFLIVLSILFCVHYRYTGWVDTGLGVEKVTNSSYAYPLFSDEWIAVSLADYSIETGSLPAVNPLDHNKPLLNLLLPFHFLIAGIFFLLGLTPLTHYVWLAILNGVAISILVYALIRSYGKSVYAASVAMLALPFITQSGNLPGMFYLLPFTSSLTFLLAALIGINKKSKTAFYLCFVISILLYPPIIIFAVPVFLYVLIYERKMLEPKKVFWLVFVLIAFILVLALFKIGVLPNILDALVRPNAEGGITAYRIWEIIPIFFLPALILGLVCLKERKLHLVFWPALTGSIFWVFYSFGIFKNVILIEHNRVVAITAVFLIIIGGFGLDKLIAFIKSKFSYMEEPRMLFVLKILTILFFVFMALISQRLSLWNKLVLQVEEGRSIRTYVPSPPVTRYLSEDDLRLFADIRGKNFISPPWKGLAVGVATHNYPLESKGATITNTILSFLDFMKADCAKKTALAKKYKIDYVYVPAFACKEFMHIDESKEGLHLYEFSGRIKP